MLSKMGRSHIYVRPLNPHDEAEVKACIEAIGSSDKYFPRGTFSLPTTRVMIAEKREEHGKEIIMYQPHYSSLTMGSLIGVSGATATELASAQHMLTAAAYTRAHAEGFTDILAFSNTPETYTYAARHEYQPTHPAVRLEVR